MNLVKRQFPSSSSAAVYTAMIDRDTGASSCNCKGWTFKRGESPRWCKHTRSLAAEFGWPGLASETAKAKANPAPKAGKVKPPPMVLTVQTAAQVLGALGYQPPKVDPAARAAAQAHVEAEVARIKTRRMIDTSELA